MINSLSESQITFHTEDSLEKGLFSVQDDISLELEGPPFLEPHLSSYAYGSPASSLQEGMQSGCVVGRMSGEGQLSFHLSTHLLASAQKVVQISCYKNTF